MRSRGAPRVPPRPFRDGLGCRGGEIGATEEPRTIRQGMDPEDFTGFCGAAAGSWRRCAETVRLCSIASRVRPRLRPPYVRGCGDAIAVTSPVRGPAIAIARDEAIPVQDA